MKQLAGIFVTCLLSSQTVATEIEPTQLIKQVAGQVLNTIITDPALYRDDPDKLYQLVNRLVSPHVDFEAMVDLALGQYKDQIDAEKKTLLTDEFRVLLINTYSKALLEYNNQSITYQPAENSTITDEVTVKSEIAQAGSFPVPLNYQLRRSAEGWKVYDVSIDDISLVTNYRSSFAREIRKNGIDKLIVLLRNRNQNR